MEFTARHGSTCAGDITVGRLLTRTAGWDRGMVGPRATPSDEDVAKAT